jgi:ribose transport system ATP-binding protein
MGAGRTETARLIFGVDPRAKGEISKNGKPLRISAPKDAVVNGIGYLSEDRKRYGLATGLSVLENAVMASLSSFTKLGFVDRKSSRAAVSAQAAKLRIKTPSLGQLVRNLSGGNQQKVIIAKWLIRECDVLIFDEPTRGIDVGAKNEIYRLMNQLASEGKSIMMISSELPEILRLSHRVACMREGRLVKILDIKDASQEAIMWHCTQRK